MVDRPNLIYVARVYDPIVPEHGARLLVDRLWPRGLAKAQLSLDGWPKAVTPSTALRQWFHADPSRWPEFQTRYRAELQADSQGVQECLDWVKKGPVTLLTAAHDRQHNHAVVLRDYLLAALDGASAAG